MNRYTIAAIMLICCIISCTSTGIWTSNGPSLGGRLSGIVASPADAGTLLVASPGGGIWKTTNNGINWAMPANYALADYSVMGLEWDKIRMGRLYASTQSDLYASTDLGETWANLTGSGGYPAKLMPKNHYDDPNPFTQLKFSALASVVFWSKAGYGLYYSFDGSSFTQHMPFAGGATNPDNYIGAIGADEFTGRVYFASMPSGLQLPRLYRSTCAWAAGAPCLSWELVNTGLPFQSEVTAIVSGGSAGRMAVCIKDASSPYTKIFTTNDGTNWTNTTGPLPSTSWAPRPLVSTASNQLIVGTVLPYVSNDWGETWSSMAYPFLHPDTRSFYTGYYPAAGGFLWATTDGSLASGVYHNISRWNFTAGSTPVSPVQVNTNGMKTWQAYFMAVTAQSGAARKRIFIGSIDNGLVASDDGGTTWVATSTPGGCADNISMVFAPTNPNRGYAVTCDGTVLAKTDNAFSAATVAGVSWATVSVPGGAGGSAMWNNASIAIDPTNADRVCLARVFNMTISENGGANWQSHNLPGNASPVSAYIDADHAVYITTLDSGIFKTTDNGTSWTAFGLNDGSFKVISKIIHTNAGGAGGTFFAATSKGLYRKLPGGVFEYINSGGDAAYAASDVEVDPTCASRIYVAKGYLGNFISHRGGVLVSNDNGNTFTSITSGLSLHQSPVSDIQIDPVNPRYVYAASYGLGGWTYVWQTLPGCQ
jgi:hypothetical protein